MKAVRIALTAASLWSVALVVGALTVPLYSSETATGDSSGGSTGPATTTSSATLVEVNGGWGLVVAATPLAVCLLVGALLLGPGGRAATVAALVVVALLAALTVLSLLSVGLFLAPVTAALGVAVLVALSGPARPRQVAG